jgi:hypothetical protein
VARRILTLIIPDIEETYEQSKLVTYISKKMEDKVTQAATPAARSTPKKGGGTRGGGALHQRDAEGAVLPIQSKISC